MGVESEAQSAPSYPRSATPSHYTCGQRAPPPAPRRQHRQRHRQRPQRVAVTVICWHLLEVSLSEKILRMPESIVLIFSPDGQILEKTQDNTSEQSAGSKFLICSDCWLKMVKETQRTNQVTNLLFCFGRLTGHMCCQTFICLLEPL